MGPGWNIYGPIPSPSIVWPGWRHHLAGSRVYQVACAQGSVPLANKAVAIKITAERGGG
jgi:hypothetical protein